MAEEHLRKLLTRLEGAASFAKSMHRRRLEELYEEVQRFLSKGYIREAAEKAWMMYRSLLGLILATRGLPLIEERVRKILEQEGAEAAENEVEWWCTSGFLVPETKHRLEELAQLAAKAVNDREIYEKLTEMLVLYLWSRYGPDIVPLSEKWVGKSVLNAVVWARRKAEQHELARDADGR